MYTYTRGVVFITHNNKSGERILDGILMKKVLIKIYNFSYKKIKEQ
jgi:hypothetical protein